nr:efflux RND transporter permease subunit [Gemmatimonadaceae bacterium]
MSLPRWAVSRPVATLAALLAVVLLGSVSLTRLPVSLLPDVTLPVLTVRTTYDGAAANEVSRFVAEPIEEALAATPGLVELRSVSRNEESTTIARFAWGTDMAATVLTVRERLDNARSRLPEKAERPTLLTSDPGERPIAVLAVRGVASQSARDTTGDSSRTRATLAPPDLRTLARTAEEVHARRLEQIAGVASVAVVGTPEDEIRIELDPERLRAVGLTPDDVATAVKQANATGSGGTVRRGQFRLAVRALTEFRTPAEIANTPIGPAGGALTLRDVGTVSLALAEPRTLTRLDGAPAVGLVVYKDAGANTVSVTTTLRESLAQLAREFPGVQVTTVAAQADFVVDALSNLGQEIAAGGILSLLVILLFLRDWRLSLAIGLTVPLSVLVALVALQQMNVTINVLSLGGLALGVGLLVDTAIVVAESVGRRREAGMPLRDAAIVGADEVSAPLFAGTLTTVLVFGPVVFVRGLAAALFRDLSLSVVMTVAASLLLALTLMPVLMAGRRAPRTAASTAIQRTPGRLDTIGHRLAALYERGMEWALTHPVAVFSIATVALVVTGAIALRMPREILPRVDEGTVVAQLALAEGTAIEETTRQAARIESAARALGAGRVYARVGTATDEEILAGAEPGSSATAQLIVPVPSGADAATFADRLRAAVPDLASGALALDLAGQSEFGSLIGREGRLVRVEVSARTAADAQRAADSVRVRMRQLASLTDVRDAFASTQPIYEVELERERLADRGIAIDAVAAALSGGLGGVNASELRETDRRTPITVRFAGGRNEDLATALATPIKGIPVGQLVRVRETRAPLEVVRADQRPVTIVEGLIERGGTSQATRDVERMLGGIVPPAGVTWSVAGADAEQRRTTSELLLAGLLGVALVFLVLAGEFASFRIPLVVITTVPLAAAGGIIALWITGQSLNAVSLIGLVV